MPGNSGASVNAGLSVGDVTRRTSLSDKTIRRAIDDDRLKAHRFGRRLVIMESDFEAFLAALPTRGRKMAA